MRRPQKISQASLDILLRDNIHFHPNQQISFDFEDVSCVLVALRRARRAPDIIEIGYPQAAS